MEDRAEAANASWICSSGKPHKDFLRKPRGENSKVRNMTIDNVKNIPNLSPTDDVGIIMDNFVTYYGELYCDKPVNIPTLDRMINNLTLKLDEVDAAVLGAPINMEELREVLRKVPKAKTPGPDLLPYKIYRSLPGPAAIKLLRSIFNRPNFNKQKSKKQFFKDSVDGCEAIAIAAGPGRAL